MSDLNDTPVAEPAPMATPAPTPVPAGPDRTGSATAGLVLGIIGMIAWLIPLFGLPITIIAIIMGARGRSSSKAGMATAGLVLGIIGLILTIISAAIGVAMLN